MELRNGQPNFLGQDQSLSRWKIFLMVVIFGGSTFGSPVARAGCCEKTFECEIALSDCSGVIGFDMEDGEFCGAVFEDSCCEYDYGLPCGH